MQFYITFPASESIYKMDYYIIHTKSWRGFNTIQTSSVQKQVALGEVRNSFLKPL